ncbi:MAG: hypothetical protein NXH70_02040 [Hyphomonas sp.]|nr:hypothetical protein [Hyphomonas sp.]
MKYQIFTVAIAALAVVACQSEKNNTPPTTSPPVVIDDPQPVPDDQPTPIQIPLDREIPTTIRTEAGKEGFIAGLECVTETGDKFGCAQECVKNQNHETTAGCLKAIEFLSVKDS